MNKITEDYILSTEVPEDEKDVFTSMYEMYEVGVEYLEGDKLLYAKDVYEVIQKHTSQEDWKPNELPALYRLFYQLSTSDGKDIIPKWVQPEGDTNMYHTGDLVEHDGLIWESEIDNNVWAPRAYGWVEI